MFLSAHVLTDQERAAAFASVAEMDAVRLNRNVALNLVDNWHLDTIDGLVGGLAREAFAAFLDGAHLLQRAAGQLAESKAAELYGDREDPAGWIDTSKMRVDDGDQQRLKLSLIQIPLETAAMFLDASLNHLANAVVRFAWEAGFERQEVASLGLDVDQPVTPENAWTSWARVARGFIKLEATNSATARFVLAQALLRCYRDPNVQAAIEYRHRLVHRGVPADLSRVVVRRSSGHATGGISLTWPLVNTTPAPQLEEARATIALALTPCRQLEDDVISFLPGWAAQVGFRLDIQSKDVTLEFTMQPRVVRVPPRIIYRADRMVEMTVRENASAEIRLREKRDHSLFEAAPNS